MSTASIRFYNHSHDYVKFEGDRDIIMELREKYTFEAPNFRYDKRYKMGYWDGKISMINMKDNHFLAGLLPTIKVYLEKEGIEYIDDTDLTPLNHFEDEDIINFYKDIKGVFKPHDSQVLAVRKSMNEGRNIVLAPTSNGKSYIIHALNVWHVREGRRVLIVVDRANLVTQLQRNFEDEYNSLEHYTTATIYDDPKLVNEADIVTSTWQSLKDAPASWFKKFDVIIGDECLHPDTLITMHDGSTKPIKDILIGDLVLTTNESTGELESKPVIKIHKNISPNEKMYEITGDNGQVIRITGNHKVMLSDGTWRRADELKEGDDINSIRGT